MSTGIGRFLLLCVLAMFGAGGCATLPDEHGWGAGATLAPGWERVRASAINAAKDPHVWLPLAGAAVFQVGDLDREVSDWARRETPVFGSQHDADRWSDDLRTASAVAYTVTVLLTPGSDEPDEWLLDKAKGYAVGLVARGLTSHITSELKHAVNRERPNGAGRLSFPSGHTSASAVNTRLASRNLRWIDMSNGTRRALDVGLTTLTVATSWARIEAGWHYPSDTLFSMALGNFLAAFINDAFLGAGPDRDGDRAAMGLSAMPGGGEVVFFVAF